jgi:hypothetical protein
VEKGTALAVTLSAAALAVGARAAVRGEANRKRIEANTAGLVASREHHEAVCRRIESVYTGLSLIRAGLCPRRAAPLLFVVEGGAQPDAECETSGGSSPDEARRAAR